MSFALAHQNKTNTTGDSKKSTPLKRSSYPHINNLEANNSHNSIIYLQWAIGNQAVQRLIQSNEGFDFAKISIRPKLKISSPADAYEQEVDRVAEQVTRLQAKEKHKCDSCFGCPICQSKGQQQTERLGTKQLRSSDLDLITKDSPPPYKALNPIQQPRDFETRTLRDLKQNSVIKPIRPNLMIGQPNDKFEQEADNIADTIISTGTLQGLQGNRDFKRMSKSITQPRLIYHDELLSRQPTEDIFSIPEEEEDEKQKGVQLKEASSNVPNLTRRIHENIKDLRDGGRPLATNIRSFFESRFGYDFAQVRIHSDSRADRVTRELHARAFTWGNQIAFRALEYAPDRAAGQHLLAHELTHVIQQRAAPQKKLAHEGVAPSLKAEGPILQAKDCNFYVYDSTEPTKLGWAWKYGTVVAAAKAYGGYSIGSSDTIEYMLKRILRTIAEEECDCVEEIQFWSHGSSGNAMSITKTNDEITSADFDIPGLDKYGGVPKWWELNEDKKKWFDGLTWRQQLFLGLREYICGPGAEIYYRSCEAFRGKVGQEFAKKSASFWRSKVIGHTKIIGVTQPGKKTVKPGQEPYWSELEGNETEMKKKLRKELPKKD